MKYLSIIIPRYKESAYELFPLLSSISIQLTVDWSEIEVIIVNDGGGAGPLDEDFLKSFPNLEIRQLTLEQNDGPGLARQAGIDAALGEYVMFCDADDVLQCVGAISSMVQEAKANHEDLLCTAWIEEIKMANNVYQYATHSHELTWMHGKMIRRQMLIDKNIRHHPGLRIHEDSYFLALVATNADNIRFIDSVTYVWKWSDNSITRRNNGEYTYLSIPTFIYAHAEANREIEKNAANDMERRICQFIAYIFYTLHRCDWNDKQEERIASEIAMRENMRPYWHYWDDAPMNVKVQICNEERSRTFVNSIETELIGDWIDRIRK